MESIADKASSSCSEESPVSSPRELNGISYKTISTKGELSFHLFPFQRIGQYF